MPSVRYQIRPEQTGDRPSILSITQDAFGQPDEARLAKALIKKHGDNAISLVAHTDQDEIVGHVLLTPAWISGEDGARLMDGMALAPVSVDLGYQRSGVGAILCQMAMNVASERGVPFVILLGHPDYYPRFGFEPAHLHGIMCPYPDAPREAFMINRLDEQRMAGITGTGQFDPLFESVS